MYQVVHVSPYLHFNYTIPSPSLVHFFLTIHLFYSTNPPLHLYTEPRLMSSTEAKTYRKKERKKELEVRSTVVQLKGDA